MAYWLKKLRKTSGSRAPNNTDEPAACGRISSRLVETRKPLIKRHLKSIQSGLHKWLLSGAYSRWCIVSIVSFCIGLTFQSENHEIKSGTAASHLFYLDNKRSLVVAKWNTSPKNEGLGLEMRERTRSCATDAFRRTMPSFCRWRPAVILSTATAFSQNIFNGTSTIASSYLFDFWMIIYFIKLILVDFFFLFSLLAQPYYLPNIIKLIDF